MKKSKTKIIGWVLSGLIAAMLIFVSARGKFTDWEGKEEMFAKMGWSTDLMFKIGIVEVVVAVLFLIPRVSFYGAILVTAYLGGATTTHVRLEEAFYMPIIMGILVWVSLGLRDPRVFALAVGKEKSGPGQ